MLAPKNLSTFLENLGFWERVVVVNPGLIYVLQSPITSHLDLTTQIIWGIMRKTAQHVESGDLDPSLTLSHHVISDKL